MDQPRCHIESLRRARRFAGGLCVACAAASAGADPGAPAPSDDAWRFSIVPFIWLAGVEGELTTRVGGVDTSADVDDAITELELAGMLHAEVAKGRWSLLFDGIYVDLGSEGSGPLGGDVDTGLQVGMLDLGAAYRLVDIPTDPANPNTRFMIDPIVGVRYLTLDVSLEPSGRRTLSESADLWDPYVGARVIVAGRDRWSLTLKGTYGGFGVGTDRDWTAGAYFDYRLARWCSLVLGYHAMGLELDERGRFDGLGMEATLHGPVIGVGFHF